MGDATTILFRIILHARWFGGRRARLAARSVAPRWLRERAERPSSGTAAMAPGSCTCCPHPLGRCV